MEMKRGDLSSRGFSTYALSFIVVSDAPASPIFPSILHLLLLLCILSGSRPFTWTVYILLSHISQSPPPSPAQALNHRVQSERSTVYYKDLYVTTHLES